MRLIDADALKEKMYHEAFEKDSDMQKWDSGCWIRYKMFENVLREQPTITPEPHWIPWTDECDLMDNEEVLVFQKDGTLNGQIRHAMFYDFGGKKKFVTWEEGITIYDVAAYMPLPEPFKGVTE